MEAFEGSKDVLKTIKEKAKIYGKVVAKEAKKAIGLHVGKVTEANPRYYLVIAPQGAMVREGLELDSAPLHGLKSGDIVTCVDISGRYAPHQHIIYVSPCRRAKIIDPVEGWVSIKTDSNDPILELTIAPDKQAQVAQMERRFEKLKAAQQQSLDPVSESPTDSSSAATSVTQIKTKLTFKSSSNSESATVPKLGGPGSVIKRPTKTTGLPAATTDDLLDLSPPPVSSKPPPIVQPASIAKNDFDEWFS